MSQVNQMCVILHPDATRADFEQAARELGFIHAETYPTDGDHLAHEELWAKPNAVAAIAAANYLEDPVSNLRYLILRSADSARLAAEFTARVPAFTHEELVDHALHATEHEDQVRAINRLAIGFINFDPTVFTIIGAFAMRAENPLLREAAVNATGFRAWPQFRPMLEVLAQQDAAENVCNRASRLLAHWPTQPESQS